MLGISYDTIGNIADSVLIIDTMNTNEADQTDKHGQQ